MEKGKKQLRARICIYKKASLHMLKYIYFNMCMLAFYACKQMYIQILKNKLGLLVVRMYFIDIRIYLVNRRISLISLR